MKGVVSNGNSKPLKIPIAHGEGRFFANEATLQEMKKNQQVVYHYCDEQGNINDAANPNGAILNIAGICNKDRNVFGMMPHPERACSNALGNNDGRHIFHHLFGIN